MARSAIDRQPISGARYQTRSRVQDARAGSSSHSATCFELVAILGASLIRPELIFIAEPARFIISVLTVERN